MFIWCQGTVKPSKTVHYHAHNSIRSDGILRGVKDRTPTQTKFLCHSPQCNPFIQVKVFRTTSALQCFQLTFLFIINPVCVTCPVKIILFYLAL